MEKLGWITALTLGGDKRHIVNDAMPQYTLCGHWVQWRYDRPSGVITGLKMCQCCAEKRLTVETSG